MSFQARLLPFVYLSRRSNVLVLEAICKCISTYICQWAVSFLRADGWNETSTVWAHLRNLSLFPLWFSSSLAAAFSAKHSRDSWTAGIFFYLRTIWWFHMTQNKSQSIGSIGLTPNQATVERKKKSLLTWRSLEQHRANMDRPSDPLLRKKRWEGHKEERYGHIHHTLNYIKSTTNK